jgi:hypothetical protein
LAMCAATLFLFATPKTTTRCPVRLKKSLILP